MAPGWLNIITWVIVVLFFGLDIVNLALGVRSSIKRSEIPQPLAVNLQAVSDDDSASARHPLVIVGFDVSASMQERDTNRVQSALANLILEVGSGEYGEFLAPGSVLNLAVVPFSSAAGIVAWENNSSWIAVNAGNRARIQWAFDALVGKKGQTDRRCGAFSNRSHAIGSCQELAREYLRFKPGEQVYILCVTDSDPGMAVYLPSPFDSLAQRISKLTGSKASAGRLGSLTNLAQTKLPKVDLRSEWLSVVDPIYSVQQDFRNAGLGFQWMGWLDIRTDSFPGTISDRSLSFFTLALPQYATGPAEDVICNLLHGFGFNDVPVQDGRARIPMGLAAIIGVGSGSQARLGAPGGARQLSTKVAGSLRCLVGGNPPAGELQVEGQASQLRCLGRSTYHWWLSEVPTKITFFSKPSTILLELRDERNAHQVVNFDGIPGAHANKDLHAYLKGRTGNKDVPFNFNSATHRYECRSLTGEIAKGLQAGSYTLEVVPPFSPDGNHKALACTILVEDEVAFRLAAVENGKSTEVTNFWNRVPPLLFSRAGK